LPSRPLATAVFSGSTLLSLSSNITILLKKCSVF
jgi:hypothetical protein